MGVAESFCKIYDANVFILWNHAMLLEMNMLMQSSNASCIYLITISHGSKVIFLGLTAIYIYTNIEILSYLFYALEVGTVISYLIPLKSVLRLNLVKWHSFMYIYVCDQAISNCRYTTLRLQKSQSDKMSKTMLCKILQARNQNRFGID